MSAPHSTGALLERRDGILVGTVLFFFFLAPSLLVGRMTLHGGLFGLALFAVVAPAAIARSLRQRHIYVYGTFYLAAALFSVFVSAWYGGTDLLVVKLFISVTLYMVVGSGIGYYLIHRRIECEDAVFLILRMALGVIAINSFVVIAEFYSPALKAVVESHLAAGSNINYRSHMFRLRGFASEGGAALSVFHALGVWIALKLYKADKISLFYFAFCAAIIPFSVLFIGRTAIVVLGLVALFFVLDSLSIRRLSKVVSAALVIVGAVYLFARNIDYFLPEELQNYSVLFFMGGVAGLEQEGTVGSIRSFLLVPASPVHLLLGIGYFGGENVLRVASDSGYIKFILAFGIPLASAVYGAFVLYISPLVRGPVTRSYIIPMVLMLFFVEIKEPFVYQGYSARLVFVLGGVAMAYEHVRRKATRVGSPF